MSEQLKQRFMAHIEIDLSESGEWDSGQIQRLIQHELSDCGASVVVVKDNTARAVQAEPAPQVAGSYEGTFAQFTRRAGVLINEEQAKPLPDNALIAFLCDAIRMAREVVAIGRAADAGEPSLDELRQTYVDGILRLKEMEQHAGEVRRLALEEAADFVFKNWDHRVSAAISDAIRALAASPAPTEERKP